VVVQSGKHPAVFLDRDGVLTVPIFSDGRSFAPRCIEDFEFYDDAPESVQALKDAGFRVVVVTNQPDVGSGLVDIAVVEKMHQILMDKLCVDKIMVCYETREQATHRRKPAPGMLLEAALELDLDLSSSFLVGDRAGDIEAASRANVTSVFIDRGYNEERPTQQAVIVSSMESATSWILES